MLLASGLCRSCLLVNDWLPYVAYESELDSLGSLSINDPLCWVYVLETEDGSYIGHTKNLQRRVGEHIAGLSRSTTGTSPQLVWEKCLLTRGHADDYERVLKTLRDSGHVDFLTLTGVQPQVWMGLGSVVTREQHRTEQAQKRLRAIWGSEDKRQRAMEELRERQRASDSLGELLGYAILIAVAVTFALIAWCGA